MKSKDWREWSLEFKLFALVALAGFILLGVAVGQVYVAVEGDRRSDDLSADNLELFEANNQLREDQSKLIDLTDILTERISDQQECFINLVILARNAGGFESITDEQIMEVCPPSVDPEAIPPHEEGGDPPAEEGDSPPSS